MFNQVDSNLAINELKFTSYITEEVISDQMMSLFNSFENRSEESII